MKAEGLTRKFTPRLSIRMLKKSVLDFSARIGPAHVRASLHFSSTCVLEKCRSVPRPHRRLLKNEFFSNLLRLNWRFGAEGTRFPHPSGGLFTGLASFSRSVSRFSKWRSYRWQPERKPRPKRKKRKPQPVRWQAARRSPKNRGQKENQAKGQGCSQGKTGRRPHGADAETGRPDHTARHRAHRRRHALLLASHGRDRATRNRQRARG